MHLIVQHIRFSVIVHLGQKCLCGIGVWFTWSDVESPEETYLRHDMVSMVLINVIYKPDQWLWKCLLNIRLLKIKLVLCLL